MLFILGSDGKLASSQFKSVVVSSEDGNTNFVDALVECSRLIFFNLNGEE